MELISKQFEKEKQRFQKEIEELRTKLTKVDDENSSLKTSMAQRASHFQVMQEDLLKKASRASSLEKEVSFLAAYLRKIVNKLFNKQENLCSSLNLLLVRKLKADIVSFTTTILIRYVENMRSLVAFIWLN